MAGGGGGTWWKWGLPAGIIVVALAVAAERAGVHQPILVNALLAIGGLVTIAGSCEVLILASGGLAGQMRWNDYVTGTIAGLASNVPEVVMIGFVVAADVRVAFVVTLLTLHINALVFSIFCVLMPRDEHGHARLPRAICLLGTDMLAFAAGLIITLGFLMVSMASFGTGAHAGEGLGTWDMVAIAVALLGVEVIYVTGLVRRFSGKSGEPEKDHAPAPDQARAKMSWGATLGFGALGAVGSLIGGHAVGDFADHLVIYLSSEGVSEMIGAILIAFLAGAASYILVTSAHLKGKSDLALSNVFGAMVQVPFVVLPAVLLFAAILAPLGVVPTLPHGGILAIDLETVSVVLFAFPTLLMLWKSISDDGSVNRLETATMVGLFGLVLYFLAKHG
ncbi:MAG TPA: sodium/calcium exchanger protein [Kofleriaceae bacterium]|nr:sodium/calcium exchanger protein [Kofleriaceae bacterium]